jgi:hypothetical protein
MEDVAWLVDPGAAVDIARRNGSLLSASSGTIGEQETGARAVEMRRKVNKSMVSGWVSFPDSEVADGPLGGGL